MSGASMPSRERQKPPDSAMLEVSGPRPCVCRSATFSSVSAVSSVVGSSVNRMIPALR